MSLLDRLARVTDAAGITVPDDSGSDATPATHGAPGAHNASRAAISVGASGTDYEARIKANIEGASGAQPLSQFLTLADGLKEFIPSEIDRYRAAFKQGKATGLTKDAVLGGCAECLSAIDREQALFADAVKQKRTSEVDGNREAVTALQARIQELRTQLAQAEQELAATQKHIDDATRAISAAEAGFASAADALRGKYKQLQQTLQGLS